MTRRIVSSARRASAVLLALVLTSTSSILAGTKSRALRESSSDAETSALTTRTPPGTHHKRLTFTLVPNQSQSFPLPKKDTLVHIRVFAGSMLFSNCDRPSFGGGQSGPMLANTSAYYETATATSSLFGGGFDSSYSLFGQNLYAYEYLCTGETFEGDPCVAATFQLALSGGGNPNFVVKMVPATCSIGTASIPTTVDMWWY